jgi:hypothetical protein
MSTGGCLNAHQQLSAITGTLSAMRRNDCPRWTGICSDRDNEYMMIDATIVRAHQHSAGARKKMARKRSADRAED